jgi:hypothetical protein
MVASLLIANIKVGAYSEITQMCVHEILSSNNFALLCNLFSRPEKTDKIIYISLRLNSRFCI